MSDDLPGLDDEIGPELEAPAEEAEPAANAESPPQWSEKELDEWWETLGGDSAFESTYYMIARQLGRDFGPLWNHNPFNSREDYERWYGPLVDALHSDSEFLGAYTALAQLSKYGALGQLSEFGLYRDPEDGPIGDGFISQGEEWRRLSLEMKLKYRKGWEAASLGEPTSPKTTANIDTAESVVDDLTPIVVLGAGRSVPVHPPPVDERTSPAPGGFKWIWLVVPVIGAALGLGLFSLLGGSDESPPTPSALVDAPADGAALVDPSEAVDATTATTEATPTTAAKAAATASALFPPEDYGPCHVHPDEDATTCRPHYDLGVSETSINNYSDFFYMWETTQAFMGPVPQNPELPIEYRLVLESTNGQRIEHLLSGGPGEPLTCVRLVNEAVAPLNEGEICGEFTAPDSLDMLIDVSAFAPGMVSWVFSTLETEPDGTRHGDWVEGGGGDNFDLSG